MICECARPERIACTCGLDRALVAQRAAPTRAQAEALPRLALWKTLLPVGEHDTETWVRLSDVLALFPPQEQESNAGHKLLDAPTKA